MLSFRSLTALFLAALTGLACSGRNGQVLESSSIRLEVTPQAGIAVALKDKDGIAQLATGGSPAFYLLDNSGSAVALRAVPGGQSGSDGKTVRLTLAPPEDSPFKAVRAEVTLSLEDSLPGAVSARARLTGLTPEVMQNLSGVRFYAMEARAGLSDKTVAAYDFILFQGAAYGQGAWYTRIRLQPGYKAYNSTVRREPEQHDGGGIPLVYAWTRRAGLALAIADTTARVAALPVEVRTDSTLCMALERSAEFIRPDSAGVAECLPVMIGAFHGDYFAPLRAWAGMIEARGFVFAQAPAASYEASWCSWGFGREVKAEDILRNLPEVKKLGIPWVVMDDGYQVGIGSWPLDKKKFPRGDSDMRALTDSIHAAGLKASLWWVPMNVTPDDPLYKEHPDWVVLGRDGQPVVNRWWNCYQLCPAYAPVVEQQRGLVRRFMTDWGYDGFKMDGSCQGMAGPCYNPAHNHARPEESCEATAALFKAIKEEAESIKPGCLLLLCECGVPPSPFKLAWYNQQVTADPVSSEQVRARIRMYRALLGRKAAPFGDHVELSNGWWVKSDTLIENGKDFASSVATGGVIGTKFTALVDDTTGLDWREYKAWRPHWEHWINLFNSLKLYEGDCLNLYDTGWDKPETHVVAKGDELFYGFFAPSFDGALELRGLKPGVKYALTNYAEGDSPLGEVIGGPGAVLNATFSEHLLVRAKPVQ